VATISAEAACSRDAACSTRAQQRRRAFAEASTGPVEPLAALDPQPPRLDLGLRQRAPVSKVVGETGQRALQHPDLVLPAGIDGHPVEVPGRHALHRRREPGHRPDHAGQDQQHARTRRQRQGDGGGGQHRPAHLPCGGGGALRRGLHRHQFPIDEGVGDLGRRPLLRPRRVAESDERLLRAPLPHQAADGVEVGQHGGLPLREVPHQGQVLLRRHVHQQAHPLAHVLGPLDRAGLERGIALQGEVEDVALDGAAERPDLGRMDHPLVGQDGGLVRLGRAVLEKQGHRHHAGERRRQAEQGCEQLGGQFHGGLPGTRTEQRRGTKVWLPTYECPYPSRAQPCPPSERGRGPEDLAWSWRTVPPPLDPAALGRLVGLRLAFTASGVFLAVTDRLACKAAGLHIGRDGAR